MERFHLIGLEQTCALTKALLGDGGIHQEADTLAGTKALQIPDRTFTFDRLILCRQGPDPA
jgi:hypothetical protein